ncbi:MAG: TetR/AcrR family transcriptional regulator [Gemmatimonadota bacterium]|nr:TetR/AcrR family transcriptional regulator [Gemmatimonadota bacterium]
MAWDTERTKQLLLDAATAEFSARGLAGARVDRIAAAAGVNKERIYQYFGNKEQLFGTVLANELALVMDAVPLSGTGSDAIIDYAGRVFDYHLSHPALARLTFWEGLELSTPVAEDYRRERSRLKVDLVLLAVPELTRDQAEDLLLTILTLADGYPALSNMDRIYTGSTGSDAQRRARRRASFLATVRATLSELVR